MPLITPPSDEPWVTPVEEIAPEFKILSDWDNKRRIELFLNVQPWLCPQCGIKNFGRNLRCANFKCQIPRPKEHRLHAE